LHNSGALPSWREEDWYGRVQVQPDPLFSGLRAAAASLPGVQNSFQEES